jgi:RNA-binding protein
MKLSSQQIRQLKKLAHGLKPVVLVGQHGLGDNVIDEIDNALDAHELIKVKLAGSDSQTRNRLSREIGDRLHSNLIQMIGRVAIFYRPNPKKKKNRIIV